MFRRKKLIVAGILLTFLLTVWTGPVLANPFFKVPPGQVKKMQKELAKRWQQQVQLRDVENHWAKEAVVAMSLAGLVKGYPDQSFRPDDGVKREEAVAMLVRLLGLEGENAKTVPAGEILNEFPAWAQNSLALALQKGIITVDELTGWRTGEPATRSEIAAWLVRAAGLAPADDGVLPFLDGRGIPGPYRAYVATAYRNQLMVGYPGNVFRPNQPVKRAEMAALMLRLMTQCPLNPVYRAVQGVVEEIDDDSVTIQLFPYRFQPPFGRWWPDFGKEPVIKTFSLSEETVAFLDGEPAEPAEIPAGAGATLILNAKEEVLVILGSGGPAGRPDEEAPSVVRLAPADGAADVDPDLKSLEIVFNEAVEPVEDLEEVKDGIAVENIADDEKVEIDSVAVDDRVLTIRLATYLEDNKTYQVTLAKGVLQDKSGNAFAGIAPDEWVFSTGDGLAPAVQKLIPAHREDDVSPGTRILYVQFNEDIRAVDDLDEVADGITVKNTTDGEIVALDEDNPVSIAGETLTIRLEYGLEARKSYQVTIAGGVVEDRAGNEFGGISAGRWTFSTGE